MTSLGAQFMFSSHESFMTYRGLQFYMQVQLKVRQFSSQGNFECPKSQKENNII